MRLIVSVLCIAACAFLQISEATVCQPLSRFKVDCNSCRCSESGKEYFCTQKNCLPIPYKQKYNFEETEDGHILLRPKTSEQYVFDDDNSFVLTNSKNVRKTRDPLPYVDDAIPANKEDDDDLNSLDETDDGGDEKDTPDERNYVDSDLEEARQANREELEETFSKWSHVIPIRKDFIN